MKTRRFASVSSLMGISLLLITSSYPGKPISEFTLVGSTPGDEQIKSMLAIPADTKIDFIRWKLMLSNENTYSLDITFGEGQPNTLGFKRGGINHTFQGVFTHSVKNNVRLKEVYEFKSDDGKSRFSLAKLNENIFHLLTFQKQLMVGNGGWSYSLSRNKTVEAGELLISSAVSDNNLTQVVYDGRTPCQEIAEEHPEMKVDQFCLKLKWRLILNRDPTTFLPTTYVIRKVVNNMHEDVTGNWTITSNPNSIVYTIEPDNPYESISFLVGDDNVLFFLNKDGVPYVGNENFSFTLNKKSLDLNSD